MGATTKPPVPPRASAGLHFMVTTGAEKLNPESRRLIRSHVMKGKNLGKILPPRKRIELNGVAAQGHASSPSPNSDSSNSDGVQLGPPPSASTSSPASVYETEPVPLEPPSTIPPKFGSDASTIRLADSVRPGTVEVVLQFSSIAKQLLYPLEACIFFERRAESWIAPLAVDSAFLHAKIFTSLYYFDVVLPGRSPLTSQQTLRHSLTALKLLRERLLYGDDESRLSNNTVSAVLSLAGHGHWTGDAESARHHMEGLHQMITLRGGVDTFKDNLKLLVEIIRCDLGMALSSGSRPIIYKPPLSNESFLKYPDLVGLLKQGEPGLAAAASFANNSTMTTTIHTALGSTLGDVRLNDELAQAWSTMSDFCLVINFADQSRQRITVDVFLETMASVMYRLLDMRFAAGRGGSSCSSADEAVRLGLLCFCSSIFLHWRRLGISYPHLTSAFRGCLRGLPTNASARMPPQLMLWLLMAGAVSVFDASDDDEWLQPLMLHNIDLCGIDSWVEMRDVLASFMWIGMVHDKPAKRAYDSSTGR